MNKHNIVNLKCPCFLFRYPNLDIPSQALFNHHRASALPLRCGSEDDKNFQNPTDHLRQPSDGAGTVWFQFGTVFWEKALFDITPLVWERALAPRGSSFTNAKLEGRRATTSYPTKTSRESQKAALRMSHLLLTCQVVFTKRGIITTTVTTATITTITIWVFELCHNLRFQNFSYKTLVTKF